MSVGSETDDARPAPPGARWALVLATAVLWFMVEALGHILTSANIAVAYITAGLPEGMSGVAARLLPLVALLAPALPLGGWLRRDRLAVRGALIALIAGLAQAAAAEPWRSVAAMIAFAGGAWFLVGIVGVANRRAIAAGLVGAFLIRELTQHAGWLLSLPGRDSALVGLVLTVIGVIGLRGWRRAPHEERGESFERRAGGIRLRGALALGAILFFEAGFGIGLRAGMSAPGAALSVAFAATAWYLVVRGFDAPRHRMLAVSLGVVATVCALVFLYGEPRDTGTEVAAVIGHTAALLLLDRSLAPVSGRRSGGNLTAALALVAALVLVRAAIWSAAPMHEPGFLLATVPVIVAGLVLVVSMYLTPRPARAAPALSTRAALGVAVALPLLAALLAAG